MSETPEPSGRLRRVYGVAEPDEVREYYDEWAATYDTELEANGYRTPQRVAEAVAELADDRDAPVLDYGCGTGLSGVALAAAGFTTIDGADPSTGMIGLAGEKGVYRTLTLLDLDAPAPPFATASYAIVTAVGVIGPGAAPRHLFEQLLEIVAPGGLFAVTFNDYALENPDYQAMIEAAVADGRAAIELAQRGRHLPGVDVQSTVYVFRCG